MERGELSFIIDGKNCGVASRDRRLKEGKYYAAILLMSAEDKITLASPRKFQMAQQGYQSLLSRLNITSSEHARFFHLIEDIQEYFADQSQEKHFHRLILSSYMNNVEQFEELCAKAKSSNSLLKSNVDELQEQEQGKSLSNAATPQSKI